MTNTSFTEKFPHILTDSKIHCLGHTSLDYPGHQSGKVRDSYDLSVDANYKKRKLFVTTDRLSAFDRALTQIPYKGQVLNLTSKWWFEQTEHIIPNHMIAVPHANCLIAEQCEVFPVEFVVRGFMTGSTQTSMWHHYQKGAREYCGHKLKDGMIKNQRLDQSLLTPTTKDEHDELISAAEIVSSGRMSQEHWEQCEQAALELFSFGQKTAQERGLILVDTKYEMGLSKDGRILLIDEIHTPDSSRYWLDLKENVPTAVDKDFIRQWYVERCDPYKDENLPTAPDTLIRELSARYLYLYERITGTPFETTDTSDENILRSAIDEWLNAN